MRQSLSNTVKRFHFVRLATLLKVFENKPLLVFENKPFVDVLVNGVPE